MRTFANLLLCALVSNIMAFEPIRLHPDNQHYFLFREKPTVLVTSGEHYGAVLNLDFQHKPYLDELKRHGLNLTRLFSGTYCEEWGEPWNTLNPPKGRYTAPWARSSQPGYADGGNKFDLNRWDPEYWKRLKSFVGEAGRRGIVVEYVLFCTFYGDGQWNLSPMNARNNVNGVGGVERTKVWTDPALLAVQERFVRKAVTELKGFDNVYFELVNEPYFEDAPKLGHPWNERMAKAISETSPAHLVALNVNNGSQKVETVPAGVSILNFHYASPPNAVRENYRLNVPIAFDESGFRGPEVEPYRREAWEFMLTGGSVYSGLDWTFSVASPEGQDRTADPKLGLTDPGLRASLGILKRYLDKLPLVKMVPIPNQTGLVEEGKVWAVFSAEGKEIKLNLPAGRYRLEWTDTKTGKTSASALTHAGGEAALPTPGADSAVHIVGTPSPF